MFTVQQRPRTLLACLALCLAVLTPAASNTPSPAIPHSNSNSNSNSDSNSKRADRPTCLESSLALTNLTITAAEIVRGNPFAHEATTVTFRLANAAAAVDANCSASDVALTAQAVGSDPYKWYDCAVKAEAGASGGEVGGAPAARFRYDGTLLQLTVNETWVCHDPDTGTPLFIQAYSFNDFSVPCNETAGGTFGQGTCRQPAGSNIYFPVDVTARSLEG
ncbi:hypothetical protein B0T26DRAFT_753482 [Lasiosphaeria miniovina]|uniref:AA1-like domain-containing protein n=1 Tax=Lasiosphaeria miniovina TaxID=1954250 RepID=A0AA40ACM4_9PEZI|nr:uncharacterized protein B0T26DRAFT_753482 [Lasiosphaeria miniovina]KAK0713366.1 hypothetical protein B0T26DRAFT_753482 [Lasiosphaeria miniovina]